MAGLASVVFMMLLSWLIYYQSGTLSYAQLDAEMRIERDALDPDQLALWYQPHSPGKVGFRRADGDRETELLDQVAPSTDAAEQRFQWRIRGLQTGSQVQVLYRRGWSLASRVLEVPPAPPRPPLGDAVLSGEVVNATNNTPVPGAEVRIEGTRLVAHTGPDGKFRIEGAPAGPVPVEVSANGFSTESLDQDVLLVSKQETTLRVVLNPGIAAGQIRLVLTWGDEPADLDAHLEGPLPEDQRFHIYFQQKGDLKSKEFVNLDVDAKTGRGPETITVLGVLPGTYHYFVHDYTNRDRPASVTLSHSAAEVRLYQGGQTYRFHTDNESAGGVWHVCDLIVDQEGKARVQRINRYDSQRLAAMVDLVFLLDVAPGSLEYLRQRAAACGAEAQRHQGGGLDCRFALVPFGEPAEKHWLPPVTPTGDLEEFQRQLVVADSPPPLPKHCVAALQDALKLRFRPGAAVQFVLLTSSPCGQPDAFRPLAQMLKDRNVETTVYARAEERETYLPLFREGGQFVAIRSVSSDEPTPGGESSTLLSTGSAFDVKKGDLGGGMQLTGIYSARTQHTLPTVIQSGGSKESEEAVAEGLNWLARHQADDGHWSDPRKCEKEDRCGTLNFRATVAETGLAVLAFQAGGNYDFNGQKYSAHVKRGLDWLVKQQKKDGRLFGPVATWYEHGIGTFALAEACAVARAEHRAPEKRYRDAARRAIEFMERHQYKAGGWQYNLDSLGCGDTSVTGWQVLALKSALEAKINVAPATMRRVQAFYEACGDPSTGQTGYASRGSGTDLTTAVGLIVQEFIVKTPDSPLAKQAVAHLRQRATQGNIGTSADFYTLYNSTLAMFLAGDDAWADWNRQVRDAVVRRQQKTGCARGSWTDDARDKWGDYARTLNTAWAVLTLEVYYRYAKGQPSSDEEPSVTTAEPDEPDEP